MNSYQKIMARIEAGEKIIIDGATGTELERHGVPQLENAWNGGGTLSHPEILKQIHKEYIRAGAEIIISNTFATLKTALRDAGEEDNFETYNRRAINLASEARSDMGAKDILIAGGISHWSWSGKYPNLKELRDNSREQAAIMAEAGADMIILEMMSNIERMQAVIEGVKHCGLPLWIGLSCEIDSEGNSFLYESTQTLSEAISSISDNESDVICIMHTEVSDIDACLDVLDKTWEGPVGVYAHSGDYINGKWIYNSVINAEDYGIAAQRWINRGVCVIGGCCGIGPEHIYKLKEIFC
ncbi:MAG: homocysteine methyltransferase [Crocinitomicaceae bacterium]|nr:homocysteine methyltransferase [Crocinitomicaceae bacterium]